MIHLILSQEKEKIKNGIAGKYLSMIFDGTTRLGEIFVIVICFVDSNWGIQQRLFKVHVLARSLSSEEIACEVINLFSLEYGVASEQILAVMHDCASTNMIAMRTLKVLYPYALGIGCFSHTLDRVGERFSVPTLHDFMTYWISLFAHSPKAKLLWSQQTSIRPTIVNSLFPVLVREKYHAGGRLLFIILLKIIIISRINATYTLGI